MHALFLANPNIAPQWQHVASCFTIQDVLQTHSSEEVGSRSSSRQRSGIKANEQCGFGVEAQTGKLCLEGLHSDTSTIRVSSPLIGHCGRCEISLYPSLLKNSRKRWTQNTPNAKYCGPPCCGEAPVANRLPWSDQWLSYGQTVALLIYNVLFFNLIQKGVAGPGVTPDSDHIVDPVLGLHCVLFHGAAS